MRNCIFRRTRVQFLAAATLCALALAGGAAAIEPKPPDSPLSAFEFFLPELYISSSHLTLEEALPDLANGAAWQDFQAAAETFGPGRVEAYIDPRSGAATNVIGAFPLIPGDGVGNRIALGDLAARVGYPVQAVGSREVGDAVLSFVRANGAILGIDLDQLGAVKAADVNPDLWHVDFPQTYQGVPVRWGRLSATLSHGNLVLLGTETWGDVRGLSVEPRVGEDEALDLGFGYVGGRTKLDRMVAGPTLEIVPVAPQEHQVGEAFAGPVGAGYGHRLVWSFAFVRTPDDETWEALVDAHSGELIAFQDVNHYVTQSITGGVYPVTSTEICPTPDTCGVMQSGWPMPFADTNLASPNNATNSAGLFEYTSGTVNTNLDGPFIRILDVCGTISNSAAGSINLGGTNGQHNCTTGGGSAGNTAPSRTAFYELNKLKEQARGWLPTNSWLNARLTANVNINNTCNAFWNGSTVNFYRSGGGCRNTGELAGVFDHEWGHGMDDNDSVGSLSNTSEAYADIAAILRLEASCVGHGFFDASSSGTCGLTVDGTGRNCNEAQTGAAVCCTDCSGVRDADFAKHNPNTPATALGFVCTRCGTGGAPCGRQVHCAAAPPRQAAWDLATRDLTAAPFNLDSESAFLVANKLFYHGSGAVGAWYTCTCNSSSSGCGSTNGYMQWLAADDDNGNVNDGTPHMTAIFNAFNRHGIACSTPTPQNSGCTSPSTPPTVSATPGNNQVALSWNSVSGASRYWVFRTEGVAGCNFGKTRIADITGTSFTDTQVANGREYYYNVVAQGSSAACYTRASTCLTVTPGGPANPDFTVAVSPSSLTISAGSNGTATTTVSSINGFNSSVALSCSGQPSGITCGFSPSSVTPPANGSANSTLTVSVAGSVSPGTYNFDVDGTSGSTTRSDGISVTVPGAGPVTVFFDDFETDQGWTTNPNGTDTATTGQWERGNPETTTSSGTKQQGTTPSGVNDLVTGRLAGSGVGSFDIDGGVTSIQSPAISLPSGGTLTLTFSYYMAHLNNSSSADFLRVHVVGSTTTQVFQELGAANDDDAVFALHTVDISSFAGQTVRIRIEAADASGASLVEAAVDDVRIQQN